MKQTCYIVDYENVSYHGLNGVQSLTEQDGLVLFYSEHANKIPMNVLEMIIQSGASLELHQAEVGHKDALDHQLSFYLGTLLPKGYQRYVVISGDKAFWALQKLMHEQKVEYLTASCIQDALKIRFPDTSFSDDRAEPIPAQIPRKVLDELAQDADLVEQIWGQNKTKRYDFYDALSKSYGMNRAFEIFDLFVENGLLPPPKK